MEQQDSPRCPHSEEKALREEAPRDSLTQPRRGGTGKKGERPASTPMPHS